jgi:hypothetical protein
LLLLLARLRNFTYRPAESVTEIYIGCWLVELFIFFFRLYPAGIAGSEHRFPVKANLDR